ncbi:Ribosomal protein S21 [Macleaya cordata]|uniref:Ribosomal protein S21 n=1 Tax=Macleaya cordata TaxID=56857 RepID=A0A200RCQ8_MACCD|nr:Ribosomal protein S21 [Macleaya cordata]
MAASSLCNFLSFFLPTQTKKPPAPQLIISPLSSSSDSLPLPTLSSSTSSSSTSLQSHHERNRDGFIPVMPNEFSSSPSNDLLSVVCPSLAYSNTLFFKSAYNVQVIVGEDEPEEALLRRFRREVFRAGVINEFKRRRFFENKQEEKKRRTREAAKRNRRRRPSWRTQPMDKQEASNEKDKNSKNEEEDNWELPEGGLPY